MDFNQQNSQPSYTPYTPPRRNIYATLSLIFGIVSLALMCTGILPIPLGALGIIFAVISRRGARMDSTAKTGCLLSSIGLGCGLLLTIAIYVFSIFTMMQTILSDNQNLYTDPDALTDQMMESIYGENYKELFEQYGIDYDQMMDQMYDY
ncbi:MAG: DUF4190 domain-containing protein [Lachnospiraceae bacterium]|nr:DUF4190 domain-containing protein [Lachnospiraceae bacterium]